MILISLSIQCFTKFLTHFGSPFAFIRTYQKYMTNLAPQPCNLSSSFCVLYTFLLICSTSLVTVWEPFLFLQSALSSACLQLIADRFLIYHRDWKVLVDEWVNATAAFTGCCLSLPLVFFFNFQEKRIKYSVLYVCFLLQSELKFKLTVTCLKVPKALQSL